MAKFSELGVEADVVVGKGLEPLQLYPMDTTIVKVGKCFQFT